MSIGRSIRKMVRRMVKAMFADVHTHIKCQVISYDPTLNTCVLQPCVKSLRLNDPDNETVQGPVIEDVHVWQPGSGKLTLAYCPQPGTYGDLHVNERSLNNWLSMGGIEAPTGSRKFDINDGVFYPGGVPLVDDGDNGKFPVPFETDRISLRTRTGDTEISVLADETININNASASVVIDVSGNVTVTAPKLILNSEADAAALSTKVDLLWTTLDTLLRTTWVPAPPDGGAALKAAYLAAFPTPPASVASTKMKLDA